MPLVFTTQEAVMPLAVLVALTLVAAITPAVAGNSLATGLPLAV